MGDVVKVVTPVGELWYVNITGQGKENFNEDGYDYVATVRLNEKDSADLRKKIDDVLGPLPKGYTVKSKGYRELKEDDEGIYTPTSATTDRDEKAKDTGIFAFTFKTNTIFGDGRPKKVAVYNSAAKKVDMGDRLIGNTSVGAISGGMQRYDNAKAKECGVSLFLNAVQLTTYVPYTGDAGFEEQGEGFVAPEDGDTGFTGKPEDKDGGGKGSTDVPAPKTAKPRL